MVQEPVRDAGSQQALRLAADEHADMPPRERQLGVVGRADLGAERLRGGRRDDVVVLGEHVQHRTGDVPQVDLAAVQLELVPDQLVVLVEILEPLLGGLAGVMRPVGDPLLHAQEVQQLLLVVDDLEKIEVVFQHGAHRRHHREDRAHELARQRAMRLDEAVDVLGGEAAGPEIDEPVPEAVVDRVAMEVDRRDRQHHALDRLRIQGGIAGREHAALADAEQVDPLEAMALRDDLHALGQIAVDIVVDGHPAVGAGRIAPIDHVEVDALIEQVADERAVLLQVRHGVAPDEAIDDQDRCPDLRLGERPVVVQGDLVLAPDLVLRRGGDRHVLVAHVLEELRAARDLLAQGRNLGGDLFRPDIDRAHRLAHERVPLRFDARRGLLGRRGAPSRRLRFRLVLMRLR